ncbi:hypothetical protein U8335_25260 [Roseiconus lacunae]|uniref:hypothetical protein n=1 Tax=Roseiconus lacunae TaxID=2605694 RepID=UPI00308D1739|nr:hypothetical protein U8335_25260 [Stieleria sp. HD01]
MDETLVIDAAPCGRGNADIVCKLGDKTIHRDRINPSKHADRKRFSKVVSEALPSFQPGDIDAELMATADRLDALNVSAPEDGQQSGDELDVSRIVRPELIIRNDVSAIAIPKMIDSADGAIGRWVHYIRCGDRRTSAPLTDRLNVADGIALILDPMPGRPTKLEVAECGRWSKRSRDAWLTGDSAPSTAMVLRAVAERIDRYVSLPPEAATAHGLTLASWVLMTYVFRSLPAVPYLYLAGPAGSGKTRTMDVLSRMAWRPMLASSLTGPTLYRGRHASGGVLFLDEAERMKERSPDVAELQAALLAGYRAGGQVKRLEPIGDTYRTVSFDCFGPVVLGCIRGLPPALSSRCITVRMIRASKGDVRVSRSLDDDVDGQRETLDKLHCWALEHGHDAVSMPLPASTLANRDAELWGPLLRIVAHSGDAAAVKLLVDHAETMSAAGASDASPEADPVLLMALHRIRSVGEIPSAGEVLERAREIDPDSLSEFSPRGVAGILKRYDVTTSKSNGRKVFRTSPETIASICVRYGYDIDGVNNE